MGNTTTATEADLFEELTAPRPIICRTTLLHDPDASGVCRDCGAVVAPGDPVAGTCRLVELPGYRSTEVRPADRVSFWRPRR